MTHRILFICLGNICRSPLAEGAMRQACSDAGITAIIDSAGTGDWHSGQAPDDRAIAVAAKNHVQIDHLRARQVTVSDFRDFDHIVALDNQNLQDLRELQPANGSANLSLFLDYVDGREGECVADPYYGQAEAFEQTWAEVAIAAKGLCQKLS